MADEELTDEDLRLQLSCAGPQICAIRRLGKSPAVRITFSRGPLPSAVLLGHVRVPVREYKPKPVGCSKCGRFGHVASTLVCTVFIFSRGDLPS